LHRPSALKPAAPGIASQEPPVSNWQPASQKLVYLSPTR
jgi:hypothetical protein